MSKTQRPAPADLTQSWPNVSSQDVAGETARLRAINLLRSITRSDMTIPGGDIAGIDEGTIRNILKGAKWPA